MKLPSKMTRFIGRTLAASFLAAVCCFAIAACLWLVFHWSSGVALSIQAGMTGLHVRNEALPFMLVADSAVLLQPLL